DRYEIASGKSLGGGYLGIDPQYHSTDATPPADLSTDGTYLAVKGRQDPRRVDVWNVAQGRHVAGWLPYAQEANAGRQAGVQADEVSWLAFVDAGHVLTLNPAGKLALWSVPGCRALSSIDNVTKNSAALSAGRKYVAVLQGNAYCIYLTAS